MGASLAAICALSLAGAIALLAGPRLISALLLLPGTAAIELVESGDRPGEAGLLRAIDAQTSALRMLPRAEPHLAAAGLALALARSEPAVGPVQAQLADVARSHVDRTLRLSPAQPRAWLMLAGLLVRDGDMADAGRALALSFAANPHLPAMAALRWPLALRLGDQLSRATRQQANLEFLAFFRRDPGAAVGMALRLQRLPELRALASDRGGDLARLARVTDQLRYRGGDS